MILLDALYVNNGGAKILLDYLLISLENTEKNIYYLLDERLKNNNNYQIKESNKIFFLEGNYLKRQKFYQTNKANFSSVLCFGNLPPNIKLNIKVYTYFHQPMFLRIPSDFSLADKLKFLFKTYILRSIKNNTDFWLVQNDTIKKDLCVKYGLKSENILTVPFYPPFNLVEVMERKKNTFLYVSSGARHKNHIRLLTAFCNFYDQEKLGQLILTVDDIHDDLTKLITAKVQLGYPVKNVGFVSREKLQKLYLQSEYLIFPSLAESFGLGLVEAIENGCKIIASDLPYTYEVCEPSITFDPSNIKSIENAIIKSMGKNVPMSTQKITNKIDILTSLLK